MIDEVTSLCPADRFSSPHGDFSFSMATNWSGYEAAKEVFVPSRGFLFFYIDEAGQPDDNETCFRPLTGISLFLYGDARMYGNAQVRFSSPHGDFSFSILHCLSYLTKQTLFSSPHGDFSFSIVVDGTVGVAEGTVFVPSRGFLFFYGAQ